MVKRKMTRMMSLQLKRLKLKTRKKLWPKLIYMNPVRKRKCKLWVAKIYNKPIVNREGNGTNKIGNKKKSKNQPKYVCLFWPRFYIVVLGIAFFDRGNLLPRSLELLCCWTCCSSGQLWKFCYNSVILDKLDQTRSNLIKLDQTWSNLIKN